MHNDALTETVTHSSPAVGAPEEPRVVLRVEHLFKHYVRASNERVRAVDDVNLEVHAGEVVVLLGPSGCGKTTLLRCVAGLERPDSGSIQIKSRTMYDSGSNTHVEARKRSISMIFQSYALWPHMTAFENVAYPLRARRVKKSQITEPVMEALALVGIPELAGQYPSQMSGGQQQRVALARALVPRDELILFDEPLSNVDARVREQLRFELAEMQQKIGFAAVYVTHDQTEALSLAHRIAVMGDGKVQQLGSPREIYSEPSSKYVANFIGTTNELRGNVTTLIDGGVARVETALGVVQVRHTPGIAVGDAVTMTCRPEDCHLSTTAVSGTNVWSMVVETSMFLGSHTEYLVSKDGTSFRVWSGQGLSLSNGQQVWLTIPPTALRPHATG